jgi:DNA-binding NtrC family response regulator
VRAGLFADRFLVVEGERAIDVATGQEVTLRVVALHAGRSLHDWLAACAARFSGGDDSGRPLIDFGLEGRDTHFEALPRQRTPPASRQPSKAAAIAQARMRQAVTLGLLQQLAEVFDGGVSGRPRRLDILVPEGAARPAVLNAVARESRLRGYVPVHPARLEALAPGVLDAMLASCLRGRHVLVLHDGHPLCRAAAARLLVALGLDSDRPHVLLGLGDGSPRCPHAPASPAPRRHPTIAARAHEQPAVYGPAAGPTQRPLHGQVPARGAMTWPVPAGDAELGRLRARVIQALEAASRGRHATGIRALRETLSMQARRGDANGSGESAFALGRVLLGRGQVTDAASAFEQARRYFDDARDQPRTIVAATHVALAWTDAGRWLEAEAAARAARIAAAESGDRHGDRLAALALARCLLWQGRVREAAEAMPAEDAEAQAGRASNRLSESSAVPWAALDVSALPDLEVARHCLASRIAAAAGDLAGAGRAAARARERAALLGRPLDTATACTSMAAVYALLGDAAAVRVQVEEGLRSARLAHAPLRAIRLRAVLAAGLVRCGKTAEAKALVGRLARLDLAGLPLVVRRPIEQVLESKPRGGGSIAVADVQPGRDIVDTVVELLALAEAVTEEDGLARKAIALLRPRLSAAAAGCFGLVGQRVAPLASDGRDPPPVDVAQRAAETGLAVSPGATKSGLEAAVPIRFGGCAIGALGCRWAADVRPDWPRSGAMLAAAAAVLAPAVRAMLDRRAAPVPGPAPPEHIVGVSEAVTGLRDEIQRAARAPFNVVIEGESGTGKELVARAIHRLGPRRHHRLCAVNCAAMTDELLDAELFGHARGAFTGAVAERKGLFEEADGGTLVLDEVSELSPRAQAKLLRAIQEGEVRRVGENLPRVVDTRIIAASNRPLRGAVEAGSFRRDLLYRLEVIRILVPPLRDRVDDIPLLAAHFWEQATGRLASRATLAPATLASLARYDWPGNVRELQNVMAALAVSAGRRGSVGPERLPSAIARVAASVRGATLDEARRLFEARYVKAALARAGGQRTQAARELGVTRQGLAKLMARLEIA